MYKIGCDPDNAPYTLFSEGVWSGVEYEIVTEAMRETGFLFELVPLPWDSMFAQLRSGHVAAIFSSLSCTVERKGEFLFSVPYHDSPETIIAAQNITEQDVLGGRCAIAVLGGSNHERYVRSHLHQAQVLLCRSNPELIKSFVSGQAGAILVELNAGRFWLNNLPNNEMFMVLGAPIICPEVFGSGSAVAIGKGFPGLRDGLNRAIGDVLAAKPDHFGPLGGRSL